MRRRRRASRRPSGGRRNRGGERYDRQKAHVEQSRQLASKSWVVAYSDQAGKRRIKSFDKKREADSYQVGLGGELAPGFTCPTVRASPSPRPDGCG